MEMSLHVYHFVASIGHFCRYFLTPKIVGDVEMWSCMRQLLTADWVWLEHDPIVKRRRADKVRLRSPNESRLF